MKFIQSDPCLYASDTGLLVNGSRKIHPYPLLMWGRVTHLQPHLDRSMEAGVLGEAARDPPVIRLSSPAIPQAIPRGFLFIADDLSIHSRAGVFT